MTQQFIGTGAAANDGTGDPARTAFTKTNANFTDLYASVTILNSLSTFITASGDATGATDTANFIAAYAKAVGASRTISGVSDNRGTVKIAIGPGTFYINASEAMMAAATPTIKIAGLIFEGAGSDLTVIRYAPGVSGPMCRNQRWQNVQFKCLSFYCNDAASNFLQSEEQAGGTNIQFFNFYDVTWLGTWQHIAILTGGNNNSEWNFNRCSVYGAVSNWVYVPAAGSSDQFVNFWFIACRFWLASNGSWFTMNKGGQIKIYQCDVSGWAPSVDTYLFNLLGNTHSYGVCYFLADGLRVEHSSDRALLLHSQWPQGCITFVNYDGSSQKNSRTPSVQYVYVEVPASSGPTIEFRQCQLLGVHGYNTGTSGYRYQQRYIYKTCTILQQPSASAFISWTTSGNTGGAPGIRFQDCRTDDDYNTVGFREVFDSDMFWNQTMGGQTEVKTISLVGSNSDAPINGTNIQFQFPLNSIVTRIRMVKPANGNSGNYNYNLQDTGVPLIWKNWNGANAGLAINTDDTVFLILDTDAKRTVKLLDSQPRAGIFTNFYLLVDYIG